MESANHRWRAYATPVAISFAAIAGLNALWHLPALSDKAQDVHSVLVYMIGGSGIALLLLWQALRDGRLTKREVGLDISGWRPWQRLLGVVIAVGIGYGNYANLQLPPGYIDSVEHAAADKPDPDLKVVEKPSASDFCFWAVLMLDSSLAELLVFTFLTFGPAILLVVLTLVLNWQGAAAMISWTSAAVFSVCGGLVVWFFRDPTRTIPQGQGLVVSPADGTVDGIEEIDHDEFVAGPAVKISIFLSIFNWPINRMPIA
ncbi:MAG: phosphatidylserine decarboxylase, partial [Planctomycetes bacterium]|nr:phosphatidylserine decarboxylase [Planctomycetota bacterium]